ncbi:MAG: type II toxin-antitoxin system VapC family toxin [Dermatophilaceae bacterium]
MLTGGSEFVVDASVLVSMLTAVGAGPEWAEDLCLGSVLHSPHHVLPECAKAIRRLERSGSISGRQAEGAHRDLLALDLDVWPYAPLAFRAWELRHRLTSYDASYVALAEALGLPLATLDAAIPTTPGARCTFLTPPGPN